MYFEKCVEDHVPNSSYIMLTINSYVGCDFTHNQAKKIIVCVHYPFRNFTIPDFIDLLKQMNLHFPLSEIIRYQFIFNSDIPVKCDYIYHYET